jgi:uncharacterized protein (TIGR03435 family)
MTIARTLTVLAIAATAVASVSAQTAPAFEVASIRPSPEQLPANVTAGVQLTQRNVRFSYLSLKDYFVIAYQLKIHQIVGPEWLGNARFEVAATLPEGSTPEQLPVMLRSLFEERFQMRTHRESREFPVYALEVTDGSKLARLPEPKATEGPFTVTAASSAAGTAIDLGQGSTLLLGNNRFEAKKVTMAALVDVLARFVDRPVVDATSLEGRYDIAFELTPEDFRAMMLRSAVASGATLPPQAMQLLENSSLAAVPDALRSLGLSLQGRRAPLEVLVIDSMERMPAEN